MEREQMKIVIVGHVDHGKSTVIGRLLADTNSLPEGKLEDVRAQCERNAKPFEYAFLLDALKDEQSQGITIDSARCFFQTALRNYIVIDAPGHIEFLKNMVTGAARAEAALLVIDAHEGIQENSKRHGYLLSMLGIRQVSILVNKMDLIDYNQEKFQKICEEYTAFLQELNVEPTSFIPLSAREGVNMVSSAKETPWYQGPSVLKQLDLFPKKAESENLPFRFPLQDIYKFTQENDDRRIFAGTVESGNLSVGEEVLFLPSGKRSEIQSIEGFNISENKTTAYTEESTGFTLKTQVYVKPGELMVKVGENAPKVSTRFKANIFWMGKAPMIQGKNYKLKLAACRSPLKLVEILSVIDASELNSVSNKKQVDRHDVAECIFETPKPIAFDLAGEIESTGRFVIVDNYEITGGGIVLEALSDEDSTLKEHIREREFAWEKSLITSAEREARNQHDSKFVVFTSNQSSSQAEQEIQVSEVARALEKRLFEEKYKVYYMGMGNLEQGLGSDLHNGFAATEQIRRLGELARILTDSGQIFITSTTDVDDYDLERLKLLNEPNEVLVVNLGENHFDRFEVSLNLSGEESLEEMVDSVYRLLKEKNVLFVEYYI